MKNTGTLQVTAPTEREVVTLFVKFVAVLLATNSTN